MSSSSTVFPASIRAKRTISRNAYLLFGIGVLVMVCAALSLAAAFVTQTEQPNTALVAGGSLMACIGSGGLVAGIVTLARLQQPIEVEVTPYRLIWREGAKMAALEFDEVVRVELVRDEKPIRRDFIMSYPVVRFIEDDGEMMEFEASFNDRGYTHQARFDARAITQEVLRHVGGHATVSPAVQEFVRSGEVDIDSLTER